MERTRTRRISSPADAPKSTVEEEAASSSTRMSRPRSLKDSLMAAVSEQLSRVGEEILGVVEQRSGGPRTSWGRLLLVLRPLLKERLSAAGGRIVEVLQREVEELQKSLMEALLSPRVQLTQTDFFASSTSGADKKLPSWSKSADIISTPLSSALSGSPTAESDTDDEDPREDSSSGSRPESDRARTDTGQCSDAGQRSDAGQSSDACGQQGVSERLGDHGCAVCGRSFRLRGNLLKHAENHLDQSVCGVCGLSQSSDRLLDHLRSHGDLVAGGGACEVCRKTFQNMEIHMRRHTGEKPYCCSICTKRFPRAGALQRHRKIHDRGSDQVTGDQQDYQNQDHTEMCQDMDKDNEGPDVDGTKGSWSCRVCGDLFRGPGFLRKHAKTHSRDPQGVCGVCGLQLDSAEALQTHLQSHGGVGGSCSICRKTFQNLETHMRSHTGVKPYRCCTCAKCFPRAGALRRHQRIHMGGPSYFCMLCGRGCSDSSALKTHRTEVHGEAEGQSDHLETQPEESAPRPSRCCLVCSETFQSDGGLRKHVKTHSAKSACGICGQGLLSSQTLQEHLQVHRDAAKVCPVCGRTFQNIDTHMRSHTGARPYHCSVCGKSFPRPGALRRHRRIHSGERPYICEFCGKTFMENGALSTHIRKHGEGGPAHRVSCGVCGKSLVSVQVLQVHQRIHTGEKPFQCLVCGKAFRQVGGLNTHMLTHSREKPFGCSLCGKCFSTKGYLQTHLRFHRKERAFGCSRCTKAFVTKNDLKKHLLTHSGEKPYGCSLCGKRYQEKRSRELHMKVHLDKPAAKEPIRGQNGQLTDFIQL